MKSVSIVMPCYRRTALLAHTLASIKEQIGLFNLETRSVDLQIIVVEDRPVDSSVERLCAAYGVEYYARMRGLGYNNVGPIYNCGIKRATGDILIMQSAECMYETPYAIRDLVAAIENDEQLSAVPLVKSLGPFGQLIEWYAHPTLSLRPGWPGMFVHAVHRSQIMKIQGYDEIFEGYGHDDDLLLWRMAYNGIRTVFVGSAVAAHQWHPRHVPKRGENECNEALRRAKQAEVVSGIMPNVANNGREWGEL